MQKKKPNIWEAQQAQLLSYQCIIYIILYIYYIIIIILILYIYIGNMGVTLCVKRSLQSRANWPHLGVFLKIGYPETTVCPSINMSNNLNSILGNHHCHYHYGVKNNDSPCRFRHEFRLSFLMYVCMYVCMYVYVCICMYMYVYVCICMYMYVYVCICMYICMYMYVYVCICMYMYVYVCM